MKRAGAILTLILLAGCSNGTYDKAMEQGKLALANGEFDKAQASFELAMDEKPKDEEAKGLYEDLTAYNEVKKEIEDAKWEDAIKKANSLLREEDLAGSIKKELEQHVKTAKSQKEQSGEVAKKLEEIKNSIGQGNYDDAQASINELKKNQELSQFSDEVSSIEESINERLQQQKAAEALEEKERARAEAEAAASKKDKYLQKLYNIDGSLADLTYMYENGTTAEMQEAQGAIYKKWDDALNEIYGVLKTQLSSSEMKSLRDKQRQWIKYRDRTANAEAAAYEGGSFASVQYVITQARLTRERCYELVNIYMR